MRIGGPLILLSLGSLFLCGTGRGSAATNMSIWVRPGREGRLVYQPDALGNRILDHSGAGYRSGTVPIPSVPVKVSISPIAGDDGANIQAAINQVKALPLDTNGFRGAVFLNAGEYDIAGTVTINASGIVLRGAGSGPDGTILRASGVGQRTLVSVVGSGSPTLGTPRTITNSYVPAGARSFNVSSTASLSVGSRVYVHRPSTANWIATLGMDLLEVPWTAGTKDLDFDRAITRIEGNRITLDAPISTALQSDYGGGTIRTYSWAGRITNVGIENIRGLSDFDPSVLDNTGASSNYYADEDHGWTFIELKTVENAWVRNATSQFFGYSCVSVLDRARNITVRDCVSLDPVSIITGGRRYAFVVDDSQYCLVQNCATSNDRHQFATQSLTCGPNVFIDGASTNAYSDAGPHFLWGNGAVWDNITVGGNNINVQNRGNAGTQHGWAGANEVIWNSKATGFVVQNPPTARNWLIGSIGLIREGTMYVGPHDPGTYDSHGSNVFPNSLYYAQLQDRCSVPGLQTREYWVGEINQFASATTSGTAVTVDSTWRTQIASIAADATVNGFDLVTNGQFVPFTFSYALGSTDRVVAASIALAMRASSNSTDHALYLDSTNNRVLFSDLGWMPVGTGSNTTVRILDLANHLPLLADGKLHISVARNVGIDWALLELQVAPNQVFYTNVVPAAADAFVRGGTYAGMNYGAAPSLEVRASASSSNQREAYLRWNLFGCSTRPQHARLRLVPASVGTNGIEHAVALATDEDWDQSALTWNTQPGREKRFATWIPSPGAAAECVVTPQVLDALSRDGVLALGVFSLKDDGDPSLVTYHSMEQAEESLRPQLLLVYSNAVPVISPLSDKEVAISDPPVTLAFTVRDPVSPANLLTVGKVCSNPTLIPPANIQVEGLSSSRTVTVNPTPGQAGEALITLVVTNPAGMTAGTSFRLSVTNNLGGGPVDATGSWFADASGEWSNPANWSGGIIATGVNMTANFALNVTASRTISNGVPRVIGNLVFRDDDSGSVGSWLLLGQPLALQATEVTPSITVEDTTATISASLEGAQGFVKTGASLLVLSGSNSFDGLAIVSAGAVRLSNAFTLGAVSAGTLIGNDPTARFELSGGIVLNEPLTINCKANASGPVPAILNSSGTNTLAGDLILTTGGSFWTFESASGWLRITGPITNATTTNTRNMWLRGASGGEITSRISDSAAQLSTAVRKSDSGSWVLSGPNDYSGNTVVSNGVLLVNGSLSRGTVHVYGGVFGGTGVIGAPVTVYAGGALAPGPSIATLGLTNTLTLAAGSTTMIDLNAQTMNCDRVQGLSNVIYGGTLVLNTVAGQFSANQSFALFSAKTHSGNFAGFVPSTPGPNLQWAFEPATGILSIVSTLPAPPQIVGWEIRADQNFSLSGVGPLGAAYRILASTNVSQPISFWAPIATGIFSGGAFSFTDTNAMKQPQRFYRVASP